MSKGTPKTMMLTSSSISFPDAFDKAKAADETEQAREGDAAPRAQTAMASQLRNMQEEEEVGYTCMGHSTSASRITAVVARV